MKWTLSILLLLSLIAIGFTDSKNETNKSAELDDKRSNVTDRNDTALDQKITPFLTFQKEDAEQAMNFYIALFDNSKIVSLQRWGKEGPGKEGTIMHATFNLNGQQFMCSDSPPIHNWDFSPAVSNYVNCGDESELERLFTSLSENGQVAMPLGNYGFSQKFGWVIDQFGVSWQLNLE